MEQQIAQLLEDVRAIITDLPTDDAPWQPLKREDVVAHSILSVNVENSDQPLLTLFLRNAHLALYEASTVHLTKVVGNPEINFPDYYIATAEHNERMAVEGRDLATVLTTIYAPFLTEEVSL